MKMGTRLLLEEKDNKFFYFGLQKILDDFCSLL